MTTPNDTLRRLQRTPFRELLIKINQATIAAEKHATEQTIHREGWTKEEFKEAYNEFSREQEELLKEAERKRQEAQTKLIRQHIESLKK